MIPETVASNGLVLLGCGKMGSAMLEGWLKNDFPLSSVWILDPFPSERVQELAGLGLNLNVELPVNPAICIIAVKPQMMGDALPQLISCGGGSTIYLSIAAGTPIAKFEDVLGAERAIIRAMPNTPAAIGMGITALIGNSNVTTGMMQTAEALLSAVGQTVLLDSEDQMDAVTALSGSGPAYVFHLVETMAAAGIAQGLSTELAFQLAKATVAGAGVLAEQADEDPAQLRVNVTSPGGTTAAALAVLMNELPDLMNRAIGAATARSKELQK
ncbi:MAG: pyrroline-5-carboxylate reductase [Rhodobacteraceae bacterium]|nr:pyrroline-5-carboxylate reductase [Paracoccaceae bacterium]